MTPCCRHHSLTERPLLRHSWICAAHSCSSARCFNSALVILTSHNTTVAKPFATFRYYCLMCVYARLGLTVTMKKRDAYHPDYLKIYPCLKERPDILKFLKQCDRKQEYLEYDLKVNRTRTNKRTMETVIWPQRELSYEHLLEEHQFAQQEPSPEETLLHEIELENLRCAVERLPNDERLLLHLRYWCDFSQAEIARHLGVTQQSVSYQERCILRKLKKLLKN